LVEGVSKRSGDKLFGRTSRNKVVIFDKGDLQPGRYVTVKVRDCSAATLFGDLVE
ncbi:MAG: TRAM domain-containing protein, partial [Rikenellaceae bacterium]|nr:TRAM domain-containing protein [Rikenellaceae bacterium]